jgi:hypothetical protein
MGRTGGAWVLDPHQGGPKVPPAIRERTREQGMRPAAKLLPGKEPWLRIRFQGPFGDLEAQVPGERALRPLCRLRDVQGRDEGSLAFYTYSHERYEPCVFGLRPVVGNAPTSVGPRCEVRGEHLSG